ncbi:MAG: glycine cleavage system protein GcvH [Chlamydiota bacterium]
MIKYTNSHEWILVEQGVGTVGITAYAQKELGAIVFAELPSVGKILAVGQEAAILESTKAAADIYSPVSGEVVEVNSELAGTPQVINAFPEDMGWLFKIRLKDPKELEKLLSKEKYLAMINS